jgi:hypothetical protein
MNPVTELRINIDSWLTILYQELKDIEEDYLIEHDCMNEDLPFKDRGFVRLRIRQKFTKTGECISVNWYKLIFVGGKARSRHIKKGAATTTLLNNIRRQTKSWEYELILGFIKKIEPIEESLRDIGKITRAYHRAVNRFPEGHYEPKPPLDDEIM